MSKTTRLMKDSGIEWIGEIPVGWNVSRVKHIGTYVNGYAFKPDQWCNNGTPIIRIQDLTGSNDNPNFFDGEVDKKYYVNNGDILVSWAATLDAFLWNKGKAILNQHIFKAINNPAVVEHNFFFWLLKLAMTNMNNDNKHGIVMQHVTLGVFDNFNVALPPLPEQTRIAAYLDAKCGKIDSIIAGEKTAIEKLKAYKQSLITETVTKGLDPNAPMKDSGIEWIGEIPAGWEIHKFCWDYLALLGKMLDAKRIIGSNLHPYIKNADVQWFSINTENLDEMDFEENEYDRYIVRSGDLMICEGGEIGKCAIVPDTFPDGIYFQKALHRVRCRTKSSGNLIFLSYVIYSMAKNDCLDTSPEKATISHLPGVALDQLRIPFPPISEQQKIAAYLDKKCAAIDSNIVSRQSLIEKLTAYKKSLIYEVVTGKKEV